MSFNDDEDSAKKALRSYAENEQRESSVKNFRMNPGAAATDDRRTAYREQQTKDQSHQNQGYSWELAQV